MKNLDKQAIVKAFETGDPDHLFAVVTEMLDESANTQTVNEQELIFKIRQDGDALNITLTFEPGISGCESPEYATMTKDQKALQNYAGHIANLVMDALHKEVAEDEEGESDAA